MADYNINAVTRKVSYTGSAGVGPYAFNFEILDENDVAVYFNTTLLTLTTDYTVTINANGTGSVTIVVGTNVPTTPDADDTIIIVGARDIERTTDFVTAGDLRAAALNEQLDSAIIFDQQISERVDRALTAPVFDPTGIDMTLPAKADRAGAVLGFNATTGNPEAGPTIADVSSLAAITADIATLADIEDGTDATDAIQTVAANNTNVTTVANISGNVTTVAGISSDVTSVAADASDIGTVSSNISNVNTVAGISSNVSTVAGNNANVTTVATNISDVNTVAGISSDVSSVAAIDSDVTTVAADGTDIGAVATNIANVNTVAGISGNVTTVAGISANVTAVAGDATDIGTVATNISNVNTVAGISSDVTTVAGISANVTSVAADATDIGTVATNMASVNTVASNSANVTTVAGISSDVTAVANISGDIQDVQDQLAAVQVVADDLQEAVSEIETVGANIADVNTVAGISSDVTTAAGNSANITTVAGISGNVTTVAGISSDVTAVAGDAADIGTVATDLTGSNNIGTVAGSISNVNAVGAAISDVSTVATNLTDVQSFANTYRIGSADPSTSLDEGDLFFNTTDNALKYYDGTSWASITAGLTDIVGDATPQLGGNLDTNGNDITFGDNDKAIFGAGSDLQIYHDGATGESYITESGTANFFIQGTNLRLQDTLGANYLTAQSGGELYLYHNGLQRVQVNTSGIDVTGTITADDLLTLESATSYRPEVRLKNTNSDSNAPYVVLQKDSASPANNDVLGVVLFQGDDSTGTQTNYAEIQGVSSNITNASEQGTLKLRTALGGLLDRLTIEGNGDISFYEDTGTTPKLFWDASAESLGIGTSSPSARLETKNATDGSTLAFQATNDNDHEIVRIGAQADGDGYLTVHGQGVSTNVKVQLNSDGDSYFTGGNVGIGTTTPTIDSSLAGLSVNASGTVAQVNNVNGATLKLTDPATGGNRGLGLTLQGTEAAISNCESGSLRFGTGNAERMRIDSSGNVGIGTSSPNATLDTYIGEGLTTFGDFANSVRVQGGNNTGKYVPITFGGYGSYAPASIAYLVTTGTGNTNGALVFGTRDVTTDTRPTERMRVASDGDVLINTTTPVADTGAIFCVDGSVGFQSQGRPCLTVNRQTDDGNAIEFKRGGNPVGNIRVTTSSTSYNTTSDYRLKENVVDMTGAITRVKALAPKRFNFIVDDDATTVDGFLAHEAQTVVPESVTGTQNEVDDDGNPVYQGIDQSKLVPLLTAALQEAIAKIETLETTQADLLARIETLEGN